MDAKDRELANAMIKLGYFLATQVMVEKLKELDGIPLGFLKEVYPDEYKKSIEERTENEPTH